MQKKINLNFLKLILESDLIIKNHNILLSKKKSFLTAEISDIYSFNTKLKQLLRIFQFLNERNKSLLYILLENKFLLHLFSNLLKSIDEKKIKISNFLPKLTNKESSNFLLAFDNSVKKNNINYEKIFLNNFFITSTISPKLERNITSEYRINSDIKDFKKLSFFIILINQSLNIK